MLNPPSGLLKIERDGEAALTIEQSKIWRPQEREAWSRPSENLTLPTARRANCPKGMSFGCWPEPCYPIKRLVMGLLTWGWTGPSGWWPLGMVLAGRTVRSRVRPVPLRGQRVDDGAARDGFRRG